MGSEADLDEFLKKVEKIDEIVKGLNSVNVDEVKQKLDEADDLIKTIDDDEVECEGIRTKTVKNRTIINKIESNDNAVGGGPQVNPNMDQQGFLSAIEQDANERYERRKKNEKLADEFKNKGNIEYTNSNYDKAIEYYTEGIKTIKDNLALYTNRAQAFIKVGKYKEAVNDCDWALRVDENAIKAYIHKARALMYMKEYDGAVELFEKAKNIQPKQSNIINDYLKDVERYRNTDNQIAATNAFLENNKSPSDVKTIIEKIYKTNQIAFYYLGGLKALASVLTDITQKTLFRMSGGFKFHQDHPVISRCYKTTDLSQLEDDEADLLTGFYELYKAATTDCDENLKSFFEIENIIEHISLTLLFDKSTKKQISNLKSEILDFLFQLSIHEYGRHLMFEKFNPLTLATHLLQMLKSNMTHEIIVLNAAQIVQNFTADKKFLIKLRSSNETLEEIYTILNDHKAYSYDAGQILLTICSNLLTDQLIKDSIISRAALWDTFVNIYTNAAKTDATIERILNILINLCSKKSTNLDQNYEKLLKKSTGLLNKHDDKPLMLIGNILQNNSNSITKIKLDDFVKHLIENIKNEKSSKLSIKSLALCTQHDRSTCKEIIKYDNSLAFMYKHFVDCSTAASETNKTFKANEVLINNCVLCMSNCVDEDKRVADELTKTNIVMDLLFLTRDLNRKEAQKSCAILLAKLTKQNEKHLLRLRELHGIEILHMALQNSNI